MISGFFSQDTTWPVPMVRVALYLPGLTDEWKSVNFLLDTGAGMTCLHPLDAVSKVGLAPASLALPSGWPDRETRLGVGGSAQYYRHTAHYAFRRDDGEWVIFEDERIRIAQLVPGNQRLPSLLGWDILQKLEFQLDWSIPEIRLTPNGRSNS